jgi:hypothetical protein
MFTEVIIIELLSLIAIMMSVVYWFSPSFTKKLIGENDPFERKIFKNNLPFWQFLVLTCFLPAVSGVVVLLITIISRRELISIVYLGDRFVWWGTLVTCGLISYGTGSHGTSVSIAHYMKDLKGTRAYEAAEFYHHILGHFLPIMGLIFMLLTITIYEFNFPLPRLLNLFEVISLLIMGVLVGISFAFLVIEGRGKYYGIPALIISVIILGFLSISLDLIWRKFPMLIFMSASYISCLMTILFWRVRHGEMRELLGEFFHVQQEIKE